MVDIFDGDFKGKSTCRHRDSNPRPSSLNFFTPITGQTLQIIESIDTIETETNKLKAIEIDSGLDDMKSLEARH